MENRRFTSKMDVKFTVALTGILVFLMLILGAGVLIDGDSTMPEVLVAGGTCILVVGMMLWLALDISYEFKEDHLYLRAGFLFTRIRYEDIESYRHLDGFMDVASGFNLLSATQGIGIMSQKVMLGEVKISPTDKEGFIRELEKRMDKAKSGMNQKLGREKKRR